MPGLKDIVKDKLLRMVKEVSPESGWKVVVVDKVCVRILSAAMSLSEIMDNGVTLIENLEVQPRQPMPEMDAIYFVRPTSQSIQCILKDFEGQRKTYNHIHLYFSSHLEDSGLQLLRENKAVLSRIRTLKELNIEFRPYEMQTFILDSDSDAFYNLYSPNAGGKKQQEHTSIANKLLTLCVTLNEYPVIRYARGAPNAESIANKLHDKLEQFRRIPNTDWKPNDDSQATLLIVDRSVDALAPIMHEYTYQAMAMDLLNIDNDVYKHQITTGAGAAQQKEMILNENDPIWPRIRHLFIADASALVSDEFKDFMSKNKTAGLARRDGGADLASMTEAIRQMPQYREHLEKYSLHMTIAQACMDAHSRGGIENAAKLEQDMAMGEDAEGKSVQPLPSLSNILRDPSISLAIKLRVLMVYIITQEGLREQDRRKLLETAQIAGGEEQVIQALEFLGVSLSKPAKKFALKLSGKEKRRKADEVSYDLFRFRPTLYFIGQDLLEEKLSRDEYPWVTAPIASTSGVQISMGGGGSKAASARTKPKAGWALKNKEKKQEEERTFAGPRIIICVLGGVTYSEMRSVYELTKNFNREVIIGSSQTLVSKQFLEKLKALNAPPAAAF